MFEVFFLLGTASLVLSGVRPFGLNLALSDLFYVAALVSLVADGLVKRRPLREWMPWHPLWITSGLILVGGLLAMTQSFNPSGSIIVTLKSFFLFSAWFSMCIVMVREKRRADRLIGFFVAGAFLTSVIAISDSLTGSTWGPAIFGVSGVEFTDVNLLFMAEAYGRYGGTLGHPNIQSQFTLVVIPIVLDICISAWRTDKLPKSIGLLVILAALVWANLLTGSVAGLVGLLFAFVLVIGFRLAGRMSRLLAPFLLIAASASLVLFLVISNTAINPVQGLIARLSANSNVDRALSETGPGRVTLVSEAFSLISQNPLTGYGMDLLSDDAPEGSALAAVGVHNAPLRSWVAGGVFVFLGVLYAYVIAFGLSVQALAKHMQGYRAQYLVGLAVSIIVWILADMVQPSYYQRFTWLTVAILAGVITQLPKSVGEHPAIKWQGFAVLRNESMNQSDSKAARRDSS